MARLTRREFLWSSVLGTVASVAGCSAAASAALRPIRADVEHKARKVVPPVEGMDWHGEWDELGAAAKREGALSLITVVGRGYRLAIESFEQAFPGVRVDHLAESSANVWLDQVRRGRRAGRYEFDLALVSPVPALSEGGEAGLWAPVKPLLFRPDVLHDGAWRDGLNARFMDATGNRSFSWEYQVVHAYAVHADLVNGAEITSVNDLLNPKWHGRMLSLDARLGLGLLSAASVARSWGNGVLERLLVEQRPSFSRGGPGQITEALVGGRYPIALGVRPKALNPLRARGLGHAVRYLDLPDADFVATNSLLYFDRAPHPAAAKLFANWILTREGQTILSGGLLTNSARTDVGPFEPDGIGTLDRAYYEPERETSYPHTAATRKLVHDLLATTP